MQLRIPVLALVSTFLGSTTTWSMTQFGPERNYGSSYSELALIDMDRDGDSDLVMGGTGILLHWRENLGGGDFGPYATLGGSISAGSAQLYAHDVDDDGYEDLLIYRHSLSAFSIYLNTGTTSISLSSTVITEGGFLPSVATPDLNGDGKSDLLLEFFGAAPVWHVGLGGGDFGGEQRLFPVGTGNLRHAHIADVDSDGADDLVVWWGSSSGDELRWYTYGSGGAASTFSVIAPVNLKSDDFLLEDFDQDGDRDIALIGGVRDRFICLLNDGAGNFGEPIVAAYGLRDGRRLVAGDIDGDGDLDVMLALPSAGGVAFLENLGAGRFSVPRRISQSSPSASFIEARDLTGDGRPDVVHRSSTGVNVQLAGASSAIQEFGFPIVAAMPSLRALSVAALDVDKDGDVDLVTATNDQASLDVYEDLGTGSYAHSLVDGPYPGWRPRQLETFDHGADGDLELLAVCLVDGTAGADAGIAIVEVEEATGFQPIDGVTISDEIVDAAIADLDGDGVDEVVAAGVSGMIYWARTDDLAGTLMAFDSNRPNALEIALAELNGVAGLELLIAVEGGRTVFLFSFVNGTFQQAINSVHDTETILGFTVADADLDGDMDVLLHRRESRELRLRLNSGTGAFGLSQLILEEVNSEDRIEFADVTGTSAPDVIRSNRFDRLVFLHEGRVSPSGVCSLEPSERLSANSRCLSHAFDADQDGDLDIINLPRHGNGALSWIENRNEGQVGVEFCALAAETSAGTSARIEAFGDVRVTRNSLTLKATELPLQSTAMFIASLTPGFSAQPGGSAGDICLAGICGRFSGPGQLMSSGVLGEVELELDLAAFPQAGMTVSVIPGDTWYLQTWFRDISSAGTSNFSEALQIRFR